MRARLRYDPGAGGLAVARLLAAGRADCTGFAALLTTLARAAGIPARTVPGMVYTDAPRPGFALHAWTEVRVEGRWQGVDPTFDQRRIDGTHVRFPDAPGAQLDLSLALPELELALVALDRGAPRG